MKQVGDFEAGTSLPGSVTVHDIDPEAAGRIRALAQSVLAGHRERSRRLAGPARFYSRVLEPALIGCVTVLYLSWAVTQALLFYGVRL